MVARSGSARDLCVATKAGLEIRSRHILETHRHRHKDFTGSQERISKMASVGGEAEMAGVLVASAAMVAEPRSWRRRLGTGGGNGGGGSNAMAAHWGAQPGIDPRGRTFSIFRLDRSELVKAFAMYVRRQIDFRWHLPWSYHLLYWNLESHTDRWLPNRTRGTIESICIGSPTSRFLHGKGLQYRGLQRTTTSLPVY
jgi:hypothetical protein